MRPLNTENVLRLAESNRSRDLVQDPGQTPFPEPAAPPPFLHLLQVFRRRRWLIVCIAVVGTLLAAVLALFVPPQYTAVAQLAVDRPSSVAGAAASERLLDEIVDTHLALLSSRDHLRRVAATLEPPAGAAPSGAVPATGGEEGREPPPPFGFDGSALGRILDRIAVWVPQLSKPSGMDRLLEELQRKTTILQERRSRLISVAFTSTDPREAAAYANRIADLYVTGLERRERAEAARELEELDRQIAAAREGVRAAQVAVQDAIRRRVGAVPDNAGADQEIRDLTRSSQEAARFYDNLLRSRSELLEARARSAPGIGIRSWAAVPKWPSSHNPLLFIVPSALVSVLAGCWLALVLERADRRLRSELEVQNILALPCAGLVPRVRRAITGEPRTHFLSHPSSPYSEAVRNIAAALQMHHTARGSRVVLITSSIPGEGKSTLTRGLSAYFATLHRRVLLIDLDILPAAERSRALTMPIARQAPSREQMREMIEHWPELGVNYLGLSQLGVDPLLFFEPEGLPRFIAEQRKVYDLIVLGGPPVLGASEARLLPALADQVLFAVRWASTKREVAEHALNLLRRSRGLDDPGPRMLAVLTDVKLKQQARLAFGDTGEVMRRFNGIYTGRLQQAEDRPGRDAPAEQAGPTARSG